MYRFSTSTPHLRRIPRVQRMLHVDVGAHAPQSLRLRHDVLAQRRLPRRLRPVDLRHPPPRDPPYPQRQVQRQRPRRDRPPPAGAAPLASRMIAPSPKRLRMSPTAFSRTMLRPGLRSLAAHFRTTLRDHRSLPPRPVSPLGGHQSLSIAQMFYLSSVFPPAREVGTWPGRWVGPIGTGCERR